MRRFCLLISLLCLAARPAGAGLTVADGFLWINGDSIRTDSFDLGGALEGNGSLTAPHSRLAGLVSPCGNLSSETGAVRFDGAVEFAGTYVCHVNGPEEADRIEATGPVSGSASVSVIKSTNTIPLGLPVLEGAPDSAWTGFSLHPGQRLWMRLDVPAPGTLAVTDIVGDSDGDGLPDWWEYAYYTNRTLALPGSDDDADRSGNLAEFGAGTHPRDPGSVFALVRADRDGGHLLQWNSVAGKTYAVHAAADLASAFLPLASGIPADAPLNRWTNAAPGQTPVFYQIRVEP